jgi:hypothetical protein
MQYCDNILVHVVLPQESFFPKPSFYSPSSSPSMKCVWGGAKRSLDISHIYILNREAMGQILSLLFRNIYKKIEIVAKQLFVAGEYKKLAFKRNKVIFILGHSD